MSRFLPTVHLRLSVEKMASIIKMSLMDAEDLQSYQRLKATHKHLQHNSLSTLLTVTFHWNTVLL